MMDWLYEPVPRIYGLIAVFWMVYWFVLLCIDNRGRD